LGRGGEGRVVVVILVLIWFIPFAQAFGLLIDYLYFR